MLADQREVLMKMHLFLLLLSVLGLGCFPPESASAAPWEDKVDPWVIDSAAKGPTEFLVLLTAKGDLGRARAMATKAARRRHVYQQLTDTAARTQAPVIAALKSLGVQYRSYWVVNGFWVKGDLAAIRALAQRADVAHVYANPRVRLELPAEAAPAERRAEEAIEWNILKIKADSVWAEGFTGQGVVVGGADTGYDWDHPALLSHYRGWNGSAADHAYNWHDATGGSPESPVDPQGHGTHTMGTMVGDDGAGNSIGVAPGARWIGCRNMDANGYGTPARYIECYEWFIAPTDLSGQNPRPDLAPDVINNSWSCPTSEGCNDPNVLLTATQAVRDAGILTVHSAGNTGSACETVNAPAAIYTESFTVGATDSMDNIASFSSRGPVTVDGSNRLKPNVSAPGCYVRSSIPPTYYGIMSGTSMAAPHVAGLAALLLSVAPSLNVGELETLIETTATPLTTTQTCGGVPGTQIPNNTFGWGRIDAWAAYQRLKQALTRYVCSDGYCGGMKPCYKTIAEAFEAASTGILILIAAEEQNGSFSLDEDNALTLQGGWDKTFNDPSGGTTTLKGAPKAPRGSLTFQNLSIVP
jgi:subtilisin family serine protease